MDAAQRDDASSVGSITVYAPYSRNAPYGVDRVSLAVDLSDLDLSTRDGAHEARARIERAAFAVCTRAEFVYSNDEEPAGGCRYQAERAAFREAQDAAGYPIMAWRQR